MQEIFEFNGWVGSILLSICAVPLAWRSFRDKHSNGVDGLFLVIWTLGEIFTLAYVLYNWDLPLILNYGLNLVFISIVVYYKLKPEAVNEEK